MHTNHKGAIAEAKVRADLIFRGFKTLTTDFDMEFDLVAYSSARFYKIQVKYCSLVNGCLCLDFRSNHYTNRAGTKVLHKHYTELDFDVLAVYSPDLDECFYLANTILYENSSGLYLRVHDPKVPNKNIKWAKDYKEFPIKEEKE